MEEMTEEEQIETAIHMSLLSNKDKENTMNVGVGETIDLNGNNNGEDNYEIDSKPAAKPTNAKSRSEIKSSSSHGTKSIKEPVRSKTRDATRKPQLQMRDIKDLTIEELVARVVGGRKYHGLSKLRKDLLDQSNVQQTVKSFFSRRPTAKEGNPAASSSVLDPQPAVLKKCPPKPAATGEFPQPVATGALGSSRVGKGTYHQQQQSLFLCFYLLILTRDSFPVVVVVINSN